MHATRLQRGGSFEPRRPVLDIWQFLGASQIGDWTIIAEGEPYARPDNRAPMRRALCRCSCGTERLVAAHILKRGKSTQCGCKQIEFNQKNVTHGDARGKRPTVEYASWSKMIGRCENPKDKSYPSYGGRGIRICPEWRASYEAFLSDMGRRPKGCSLDRINVNGNYEPSNCRWADKWVQAQNKRVAIIVEYEGESLALREACRRAGEIDRYKLIHSRMRKGISFEQALALPTMTPRQASLLAHAAKLARKDIAHV